MKKRVVKLLIVFCFIFLGNFKVNAASLSISASNKTVTLGGSTTITVKVSDLAGKFSVSSSDGNVLSGGSGATWIENGSESFKFTAKKVGTATITVKTISAASFSTGSNFSDTKSITINVVKPREKSNNNNLKSLGVEGYNITPEFNQDTLEYSVELPADATKIQINANKADGYASLDGAGEKDVQEGENRFEIVVTSETGKSKTYVLIANVKDNNPITREVDGKSLTVVKRIGSLTKPENFEETKVTIDEFEIPAFYNDTSKITLIGLKDETGKSSLYIYDEKNNKYTKYQALISSNIVVVSKEPTKALKDYKKVTLKLEDNTYQAYQSKNKEYYLVYGINLATGKENWYSYHKTDNTLQIYNQQEIDSLTDLYNQELENYKMIIIALGSFSILLLFIILIMILKRSKKKKVKNKTEEPTNEVVNEDVFFNESKSNKKKKK